MMQPVTAQYIDMLYLFSIEQLLKLIAYLSSASGLQGIYIFTELTLRKTRCMILAVYISFDSALLTTGENPSARRPYGQCVIFLTLLRGSFSIHCAPVHHAPLQQLSAHTTV